MNASATPPAQSTTFRPTPGAGGLPRLTLAAADGARAEVYLHGAHVTAWTPAGDAAQERLFLSATSAFRDGAAIRGGVPVAFPQFAGLGPLPKHGFARNVGWSLVEASRDDTGAAAARLALADSEATRRLWPHRFRLELGVRVIGRTLELTLEVRNAGADAFSFTGALHTYLRVGDVRTLSVHGLRGARYRDTALGREVEIETADSLRIDREIDRIYHAAPRAIEVREPQRVMHIATRGFPDTVVWNPGPVRGATLEDLEPDGYLRMLCIEAAVARAPHTVQPGESWHGSQHLAAS